MDRLRQWTKSKHSWPPEDIEPLWGCTGCGQCTTYCKHGNQPGTILLAARAHAVATDSVHPGAQDYPTRFHRRENRLSGVLKQYLSPHDIAQEGEIAYWPGCDALDKSISDVRSAMELFRRWNIPIPAVDTNVSCAGYPLIAAGHIQAFRDHAKRVARTINRFHSVVVHCSACLYVTRKIYPSEGIALDTSILSVPEYLCQRSTDAPSAQRTSQTTLYYHDPCYLARYENIVEEPRTILSKFAQVREFSWSRTETECCGGGGLLPKTMPT